MAGAGSSRTWFSVVSALVALGVSAADAGPNGGTVAGGNATIQGQGTGSVTVNQSSQNAIINWQTFNLATGETATFNQQMGASSITLNRVIGGYGPSFIDGTLRANGRVFVVNGDGVLFGRTASVNTAGFLATTSDIRNEDFMAGRMIFDIPGRASASIVNSGNITAANGGFAALVAPGVRNSGTITATLGTVSLAAGNAFTLDFYGDKLVTLAVNDQIANNVIDVATGKPLKSLVQNKGTLSANGGRVELTAAAARAVVDSVINNTGVVEANSIGTHNGRIVLTAANGTVRVSGKISAAGKDGGTTGGTVVVTGENIKLAGANIDASGNAGGGEVLIGGAGHSGSAFPIPSATTMSVDAKSVINVSATSNGNGGTAVLWSDQQTTFNGTILAQGGTGGGNGGLVETSGHTVDFSGGRVVTLAPMGQTGTWLVDPTDLTINSTAAATISSNLATSNVLVQTNADGATSGPGTATSGPGDIIINSDILWASNNTLTLSAYHDIDINALIRNGRSCVECAGLPGGSLILRADNSGTGSGTVKFGSCDCEHGIDFSQSTGGISLYYNPTSYTNPTDFSSNVATRSESQFTAYMLVPIQADAQSKIYGNSDATLTYTVSGNAASALTFSGSLTRALGENVGTYAISQGTLSITSTPLLGQKYDIVFFDSNLTITPRPITVTANPQTISYGSSIPSLSYAVGGSGLVNGDTLTGSLTTTATSASNVGQYAITQGTLSASSDYQLTYIGADLTIGPAAVTVRANSLSMIYGNAVPALTYSVSGLLNGDKLTGGLSTTATSSSNVGQYLISQGTLVASPNYTLTYVPADLTVLQRPLTVTANPQTLVYGNPISSLTYTVGGLGLVNGNTLTGSLASGATASSSVGQYPITQGTLSASSNYQLAYFPADVTVTSRPLIVTAIPQTIAFGSPVPPLTYTLGGSGLVNGDTLAGSLATTATSSSNAGQYPITQGTLGASPNYAVEYTAADLTITPLPTTTTPGPQTAGSPPPAFGVTSALSAPLVSLQLTNRFNTPIVLASLPPPVVTIFPLAPGTFPVPSQLSTPLPRLMAVPPAGETRFVKDEVILQVACDAPQTALDAVAREMRLTFLASACLATTQQQLLRAHIDSGQTVAQVIRAMVRYRVIALAQPNYIYITVQDQGADADLAGRSEEGDAAQYALGKLGAIAAHKTLKGGNITIAVIDSEIDVHHPDLDGVIAEQYDAVGKAEAPHPHGTGMAGAIAAHRRLMGIAPDARLYAVHAFSSGAATAESTTYAIRVGLDWAAQKRARVINMSFAGPRDPSIERALKTAHDDGVVLIAAAGNAGPKSAPLFPAADPNVIAVTATDVDDKVFSGANRGAYIAVAAPGVDILVPGTDGGYQLTTGTSVACAEVSGAAALLLESNPKLTPEEVRKILTTSAKRLGASTDYGAGLVDIAKAIQEAGDLRLITPARR